MLAERAGVHGSTVRNVERGLDISSKYGARLRQAFEDSGVMLLDEGATCDGVTTAGGAALRAG